MKLNIGDIVEVEIWDRPERDSIIITTKVVGFSNNEPRVDTSNPALKWRRDIWTVGLKRMSHFGAYGLILKLVECVDSQKRNNRA